VFRPGLLLMSGHFCCGEMTEERTEERTAMLQPASRSSNGLVKSAQKSVAHQNLLSSLVHVINAGKEMTKDDVLNLQGVVTEIDQPTFESVFSELSGLITPVMQGAHEADQTNLDQKCSTINSCKVEQERHDTDDVQPHKVALQSARDRHFTCRAEQMIANNQNITDCNDKKAWYDCVQSKDVAGYVVDDYTSNCWWEGKPAQSQLTAWFRKMKERQKEWLMRDAKCTHSGGNYTETMGDCNNLQREVEGDYCMWYGSQWTMWKNYNTCWDSHDAVTDGKTAFDILKENIMIRQDARKYQYITLQQIECIFENIFKVGSGPFTSTPEQDTAAGTPTTVSQADLETAYDNCHAKRTADYSPKADIDFTITVCTHHEKLSPPVGEGFDIPAPGDSGKWEKGDMGYKSLLDSAAHSNPVDTPMKCDKGKHAPAVP